MKLSLFGVGAAGVRIVDRLLEAEASRDREFTGGNVLVFDTTTDAFAEATFVPEQRRVLLGETHPDVDHATAATGDGSDAADDGGRTGAGVDGDPDLGAEVAQTELPEIRRALDSVDETEVDAALVVLGLGGGTGCGAGSVLLEELQSIYEDPVYVLGVLPAATEPDRRALTAARGVRTVVPLADAVFPVDNETWREGADRIADRYEAINDVVMTRLLSLFAAGEAESTASSEIRVDPADLSRTLAVGGMATIGQATHELDTGPDGLLDRLRHLLRLADESDRPTDAATVKRLIKRALESKLTLPCDVSSADRVLLLLSGPPGEISRKGFETGRYLLEQEADTVEVLAGDEPLSGATSITATVLLANVTAVPRIDQLQQRALDVQEETAESSEATDGATAEADGATAEADHDHDHDHEFEFRNGRGESRPVEPDNTESGP
ncbi:MAG: tubulin/FtsZ family protein [Halolamina sp.]